MTAKKRTQGVKKAMLVLAIATSLLLGAQSTVYADSLMVVRTDYTKLIAKEKLDDPWLAINPTPAGDVRVAGRRISYIDTVGSLYVKDGKLGTWHKLYVNSGSGYTYGASESLIVVQQNGALFGKNTLDGQWVMLQSAGASDLRVDGNRITYTDTNTGHFIAKDGLYGQWYDEYRGYSNGYAASDKLFITLNGFFSDSQVLYGKDKANGDWVALNPTPVDGTKIKVVGNRITYTDINGHVWAKDGLYGQWYDLYTSPTTYVVSDKLFVMELGSELYGKENLASNWVHLNPSPTTNPTLNGVRMTYLDANTGELWAKDGLYGQWYVVLGPLSMNQYAAS